MLSCCFILFCLIALSMVCQPAFAQNTSPAAAPANDSPASATMPSDPKELMLLAAKTNGLISDDMKPWHLKVSYKYFDDQGKVEDQGTFEEFWVSQSKYKLTFTSKNGSRTEYGTDKGVLNSDSEKPVDTHDMRRHLLSPVPSVHPVENSDFSLQQETIDGEKLNCLNVKRANGNSSGFTYCLDTQTPALRTTDAGGTERVIRKNIIRFQGHYIAEDMQMLYGSTRSLTAHLDRIEALNTIDDDIFAPPSNAVPQNIEVHKIKIVSAPLDGTRTATPSAAPIEVTSSGAMPSDPKDLETKNLMLLAYKTNGLTGDDIKPWHLKASYTVLDENGKTTDQGTYEEFFVSPTKYKRSFTGTDYKYTEYGTEKGVMFSGDQNKQFRRADELRSEFLDPLPGPQSIEQRSYFSKQLAAGGVKLTCVSLKDANGNPYGPNWCFDTDAPLLRVGAPSRGVRSLHNGIVSFQGRSIPGDLKFVQQHKPAFTAHLDSIEVIPSIDEAFFVPPADATPLKVAIVNISPPERISVSGGVMAGALIKRVRPDYPPIARAARVQGTVVLQAIISKDGYITNLHVISGPPMLQQAAMDAVKEWRYRPYLLLGQPVEVQTTVNVIFTLGG